MNRIELRTYYRKSAGMLLLANVALLLVAACFAILLPFDIPELQAEDGNGLIVLNGMYAIFAVGFIFALMLFITGIVALASQSEGVFTMARNASAICTAVMLFSGILAVMVLNNKEIVWDDEHRVWAWIYLISSILSVIYSLLTVKFAHTGMRYYDKDKKLAKDVPDMDERRPAAMKAGVAMISGAVFVFAISMMSHYFSNMIKLTDKIRVADNKVFSTLFTVLFIVGLCVVIDTVVLGIVNLRSEKCSVFPYVHWVFLENIIYVGLFVVIGLISMGQPFAKEGYFLISEVVFTFFLCACVLGYAIVNLKSVWKNKKAKV